MIGVAVRTALRFCEWRGSASMRCGPPARRPGWKISQHGGWSGRDRCLGASW